MGPFLEQGRNSEKQTKEQENQWWYTKPYIQ